MGKKILNQTNVVLVALYTFSQMTQVIFYKTCHLKKLFKNPPPFLPTAKEHGSTSLCHPTPPPGWRLLSCTLWTLKVTLISSMWASRMWLKKSSNQKISQGCIPFEVSLWTVTSAIYHSAVGGRRIKRLRSFSATEEIGGQRVFPQHQCLAHWTLGVSSSSKS